MRQRAVSARAESAKQLAPPAAAISAHCEAGPMWSLAAHSLFELHLRLAGVPPRSPRSLAQPQKFQRDRASPAPSRQFSGLFPRQEFRASRRGCFPDPPEPQLDPCLEAAGLQAHETPAVPCLEEHPERPFARTPEKRNETPQKADFPPAFRLWQPARRQFAIRKPSLACRAKRQRSPLHNFSAGLMLRPRWE